MAPLITGRLLLALPIVLFAHALMAASATEQVYEYRIKHPVFGDVGTYVNTIKRNGEHTDVQTKINVKVTIIGNVVYRQDAERSERWNNGRLSLFRGITETNGTRVEVHGQAQGDTFVITAPQGTVVAPADVHPTNPWSPRILRSETMMASATGRLVKGRVVRVVEEDVARRDGTKTKLRRYEIESDQRQFVWFDDDGIARAFRIEESGAMIDFVLVRHTPSPNEARVDQP